MTAETVQPKEEIRAIIREELKAYMDNLFRNPVMLDSLASTIFSRGVAAFNFRAQHSTQRMPTLVVSENYIPGAIRVTLDEQGALFAEQQLIGSKDENDGWEPSPSVNDDQTVKDAVRSLVLSYGGVANKAYYVLDDISLDTYRKELSDRVARRAEETVAKQKLGEALADPETVAAAEATELQPAVTAEAKAF